MSTDIPQAASHVLSLPDISLQLWSFWDSLPPPIIWLSLFHTGLYTFIQLGCIRIAKQISGLSASWYAYLTIMAKVEIWGCGAGKKFQGLYSLRENLPEAIWQELGGGQSQNQLWVRPDFHSCAFSWLLFLSASLLSNTRPASIFFLSLLFLAMLLGEETDCSYQTSELNDTRWLPKLGQGLKIAHPWPRETEFRCNVAEQGTKSLYES